MKILCVHNYYGSSAPSGENVAFEAEARLLEGRGHEVTKFLRHSDDIRGRGFWGSLRGGLSVPWNPWSVEAMRREVERCQPDVVHVHNTFPLLSPAILRATGDRAARVLTLHNYRLFCAAAIPLRAGRACTECLKRKSSWPALRYGCYRGSRLATAPLALSISLHRCMGTWASRVDAFITLTPFQQRLMIEAGLPHDKVYVKPNFYPGSPQPVPWGQREKHVVFVGRLSVEKGVEDLVRAWLLWGESAPELRIIGEGPLRESLQNLASSTSGVPIRFLGQVPPAEAENQIAHARMLVLPSICIEGFPMVIREAFAYGTPVAASEIGPLPSIVREEKEGAMFKPGNPEALLHKVRSLWTSPGMLQRLGDGARAAFDDKYNEDSNYKMLVEIYAAALAKRAA